MRLILLGTAAIIVGTWIGAPILTLAAVGAVFGFGWPRYAASNAAIAGALAWAGVLLTSAARGDAVGPLSAALGGAIGVPAWVLVVATLLYPAMLASSAAWLAHLASPRRLPSIDSAAAVSRGQPPT